MKTEEKILVLSLELGEFVKSRSIELGLRPADSIEALTTVSFALSMQSARKGMEAHAALLLTTIVNSFVEKFLDMEAEKYGESSVQRNH